MKKSTIANKKYFLAVLLCLLIATGIAPTAVQAAPPVGLQIRLGQLQLLLQGLLAQVSPKVKGVSTVVATNDAELANAIKNAKSGDTIQLAPGNYSTIQMTGGANGQIKVGATVIPGGVPAITSAVTITSQSATNMAVIQSIDVRNSGHWHFKALSIRPVKSALTSTAAVNFSGSDSALEDSIITFGDATNWSAADWVANAGNGVTLNGTSVLIRNNTFTNVNTGIVVYSNATSSSVKNNTIDGIGGDGIQVLSNNVTVDSNVFKNFKKINSNGDDCMQSWGTATGTINQEMTVKGVTVQNNLCLNNEGSGDPLYDIALQGFGAADSSMQNWTVKNNVFIGTAANGMVYSGAVNMNLQNNTIIDADAGVGGADNILIRVTANRTGTIQPTGNTFKNNLSNKFPGYGSSSVTTNNVAIKMADYDKYFRDWRHGDVRLLSASPLQSVGANLDPAAIGYHTPVVAPIVVTPASDLNLSFSSDAERVLVGESVTLTWNATAVTGCTASGGWTGEKDTSGSEVIDTTTLRGPVSFGISCTGATGAVSQNIVVAVSVGTVVVVAKVPRPTITFTANPVSFTTDESTVLTWSSTNATACTASGGWSGSKETSGTETVSNISTEGGHMFSLACTGQKTRVAKNLIVQVSKGTGVTVAPQSESGVTVDQLTPTDPVSSETSSSTETATSTEVRMITAEVAPVSAGLPPVVFVTTGVALQSSTNVRETANGKIVGMQAVGAAGTLGNQAPIVSGDISWVYVNFSRGVDGYVAKNVLKIVTLPSANTPQPVPAVAPVSSSTSNVNSTTALQQRLIILQHILAKRLAEQ